MATLPTHLQNKPNSAAIAATLANQAKAANPVTADPKAPVLTFRHLSAGSSFIMPSGKVLVFTGPKGGVGDYTTSDSDEIAELMAIARTPNTPMELVLDKPITQQASVPTELKKPVDPTIAAATADAAASAERAATPEIVAAQEGLAKIIASTGSGAPAA